MIRVLEVGSLGSIKPGELELPPEGAILECDIEGAKQIGRLLYQDVQLVATDPAWVPNAANLNALPLSIRTYIRDLETKCDPAGTVQENAALRDQVAGMRRYIEDIAESVEFVPGEDHDGGDSELLQRVRHTWLRRRGP